MGDDDESFLMRPHRKNGRVLVTGTLTGIIRRNTLSTGLQAGESRGLEA